MDDKSNSSFLQQAEVLIQRVMALTYLTGCDRNQSLDFLYSLQVAWATLELVFLLRVRQMKAPASISFERSTPV